MTHTKNANNNAPDTSNYDLLVRRELEAYVTHLEKAFDRFSNSTHTPFEKLHQCESIAKQLDYLEQMESTVPKSRLAALSQKLSAKQKELASGALKAFKFEIKKIPLTLKEAAYQRAPHRYMYYRKLKQQANKLSQISENLLSASDKKTLAPLCQALEQHFTAVEKNLRDHPMKNKAPEDFHTYFRDNLGCTPQKSIGQNIETLKNLVAKLDFLNYVRHKIQEPLSKELARHQNTYQKSLRQMEATIEGSLEQHLAKVKRLMQKPYFLKSPTLRMKELLQDLKMYDAIFYLPKEIFSDPFIERMEQLKQATLSLYYSGQWQPNFSIVDKAASKKEKNTDNIAVSFLPKQNPRGNVSGLEEACLQLKQKNTQLKLQRINGFGIAPAQELPLSSPEKSIRPGDILFRGEAARIFSGLLKKQANPDSVYQVLQQSHPKDIFRVSDPASSALQDFLAGVERERMQKMLQEKMQQEQEKLRRTLAPEPQISEAIKNYKTQKLSAMKAFEADLSKLKTYPELLDACHQYLQNRQNLRTKEIKNWQNIPQKAATALHTRIENWKNKTFL